MILNPFYEKRYTRAEVDQVFSVTSYIFEQFFQQFFIKKKMTQTGAVANPLRKSRIVVLDGGLGTEIERSYQKQLKGPLWSAEILCTDPHIIKSIHRAYLDAGAGI